MNNQVTCFLLYGSDNQQNKTIKGLTESSRTDQIFLLTDHPEDKDIPTEKCHILPSFSFQHTEGIRQMLAQYGAQLLGESLSQKSEMVQAIASTVYGVGAQYGVTVGTMSPSVP